LVVDAGLDEQPGTGRARLAGVLQDRFGDEIGCSWQVGVGEDDLRRLATQFEHRGYYPFRGGVCDLGSDVRGADESNRIDAGMRGELSTGFGPDSRYYVEHPNRQTSLRRDVRDFDCGARSFVGGLENDGVAGGEGRRDGTRHELHGVVPCDDVTSHAQRLAPGVHVQVVRERDRVAVVAIDRVRVEAEVSDGDGGVGACLGQGFTGVFTFQPGQPLLLLLDCVGHAAECGRSLDGRYLAPGGECLPGGGHRAVDLVGAAAGDRTEWSPG
jgi:hypothetical protein